MIFVKPGFNRWNNSAGSSAKSSGSPPETVMPSMAESALIFFAGCLMPIHKSRE
jgi:hypothetical protein